MFYLCWWRVHEYSILILFIIILNNLSCTNTCTWDNIFRHILNNNLLSHWLLHCAVFVLSFLIVCQSTLTEITGEDHDFIPNLRTVQVAPFVCIGTSLSGIALNDNVFIMKASTYHIKDCLGWGSHTSILTSYLESTGLFTPGVKFSSTSVQL